MRLWFLAMSAAACGADNRPETLAYITETILAPSCALAECHSAMTRQCNYAFDNPDLAQVALDGTDALTLIEPCAAPPCPATAASSYLIKVITVGDRYKHLMPYDSAMPQADIQLIEDWIRDGAAGYVQPVMP